MPICNDYVQCLCAMPICNAYVQCLCAMPMCNAYVQCLCAMPVCNSCVQFLCAMPMFNAYVEWEKSVLKRTDRWKDRQTQAQVPVLSCTFAAKKAALNPPLILGAGTPNIRNLYLILGVPNPYFRDTCT